MKNETYNTPNCPICGSVMEYEQVAEENNQGSIGVYCPSCEAMEEQAAVLEQADLDDWDELTEDQAREQYLATCEELAEVEKWLDVNGSICAYLGEFNKVNGKVLEAHRLAELAASQKALWQQIATCNVVGIG